MGPGVCLGMADDADRRAEGRNHRERVGPPGYCGLGLRLLEHLRGCPCVPARLQDGAGGDCLEATWTRRWSGRSPDWLKFKNPEAPAVKREAEEGLGQVTRA